MFRKLVTGLGAVVITLALASPAYAAPERYEGDLYPYAQTDQGLHVPREGRQQDGQLLREGEGRS